MKPTPSLNRSFYRLQAPSTWGGLSFETDDPSLHSGYIASNIGHVAIFPETTPAIVVLADSAGLADTMRLLSQILIEMLFENKCNPEEYLETARSGSARNIKFVGNTHKALLDQKTSPEPCRPISAYVGRCYNSLSNYFIDIKGSSHGLQVAYMGNEEDTFDPAPYQDDSFFWWMNYDEMARRARLP